MTAAVKAAYSGGITVSLGGQTTTYAFDSTAGGSGSAYSIEVDGEQVRIGFEDMAGQPGCDYDYNDREWIAMVRQTGTETVVYSGSSDWYEGLNPSAAQVVLTVTENKVGYEGRYFWNYHVTNNSFDPYPVDPGMGMFTLDVPEPAGIADLQSSLGWEGTVGVFTADPNLVHWQPFYKDTPRLMPGESADFSFTTPVCGVGDATGEMDDAEFAYGGGGPTKGPELIIRSVTWGSVNAAGALSENKAPDGSPMPGGGKKVFADRLRTTDGPEDSGNQVYVRVELSHIVQDDKLVEGWLFDVDDPSSADAKLDDESKPTDNRGATINIGSNLITVPAGRNSARIKIKVSTQPGDNFRFAATVDPDVDLGNTVKPKEQGQGAGTTYGDGGNAGIYHGSGRGAAVANQDAKTVKSELLTVWRRLHVERDHMGTPPANHVFAAGDNPVTGPLHDPAITLLRDNLYASYIQVLDDLALWNTRKEIDFANNLGVEAVPALAGLISITCRDVPSEPDLWVSHIISAYEGDEASDFDFPGDTAPNPVNPEDPLLGYTLTVPPGGQFGDGPSFIFTETIWDVAGTYGLVYPNDPPVTARFDLEERIVLHEVLHRFGLHHVIPLPAQRGPGDEGLMDPAVNMDAAKLTEHKLTPGQLAAVRATERP